MNINMAENIESPKADFCIEIQYKKESENPSRVFRTMSDIIDTFQEIDKHLIKTIDINIEPTMLLEDIETGSIKTWLLYVLKRVPDDSAYGLDWKPIVGQYLVKAKYILINFLEGRTTISNLDEVKPIEDQIYSLAENTKVRWFPPYNRIQPRELLEGIQKISSSLANLNPEDRVLYITPAEQAQFNLSFKLVPDSIESLLAVETISASNELILKVKKPDYLGESMWDFRFGDKIIQATITDKEWLDKFQSRKIDIKPGDSIRGVVQVSHRYDYDGELISTHYDLNKVIDVVQSTNYEQLDLFNTPRDEDDYATRG